MKTRTTKLTRVDGFSRWEQLHTVRLFDDRPMYWYLNPDHSVRPATLWEWAMQLNDYGSRKVNLTVLGNGKAHVSTVFIGLDYNCWLDTPPEIFETLVNCPLEDYEGIRERYATWNEARQGHEKIVVELLAHLGGFLTDQTKGV